MTKWLARHVHVMIGVSGRTGMPYGRISASARKRR